MIIYILETIRRCGRKARCGRGGVTRWVGGGTELLVYVIIVIINIIITVQV